MNGLLWALKSLVWNSDYLPQVSVILADITSIDPGVNSSNRPVNSLANTIRRIIYRPRRLSISGVL